MRKLYGLAGKAGSGKDTAADILVRELGFAKYSFARPLKDAAACIFGLTDEQLYGDQKEVVDPFWGVTPRYILQQMGTEAMRMTFGSDIWTQVAERWLQRNPDENVVIADVRFENEARWVRDQGGIVVHIQRNFKSKLANDAQSHASEAGLRFVDGDWMLFNEGSRGDFEDKILNAVRLNLHV